MKKSLIVCAAVFALTAIAAGQRQSSALVNPSDCVDSGEALRSGIGGCRDTSKVPVAVDPSLPSTGIGMLPAVDKSTIPPPVKGYNEARMRATPEAAEVSDIGAFRTTCAFSHMNFDDGIVFPGQVGASHLHAYFGNVKSNAHSTATSLRTTGNSTCLGGTLNRSSYWVPTMVHHTTGKVTAPDNIVVYYKTGYSHIRAADVQPLPDGLRMVAGDMGAYSPAQRHSWEGPPRVFECESTGAAGETIPTCPANSKVLMTLSFPQCWDGVNLDSPDHKSHLSYRVGDAGGRCPASHPKPIPEISFNVRWDTGIAGSAGWRLSSDNYLYTGDNAGYSAHGDWFNGWSDVAHDWLKGCIQGLKDCKAHLLGNGKMLY